MNLTDVSIIDFCKCLENFKLNLIAHKKEKFCSSIDSFINKAKNNKCFSEQDIEELTSLSEEIYQETDLDLESEVYEILIIKHRL